MATTFHLFGQLPTELRLEIWRLCLPRRVLELDYQRDDVIYGSKPHCAKNRAVASKSSRVPSPLSHVNQEARSVTLATWQNVDDLPPDAFWPGASWPDQGWSSDPPLGFDSQHTLVVHLNWTPVQDGDAIWEANGNPFANAAWVADQIPGSEVSMDALLLECVGDGPWRDVNSWTQDEMREIMRRRNSTTVTIVEPVFIHGDFRTATQSGLFGLLGDAPVQVVPLEDKVRLDRFLELGKEEGMRLSYDPFDSPYKHKQPEFRLLNLQETIAKVFGSVEDGPRFEPAIMFRYCPHNCALDLSND